jgi:hypothetical protein
MYFQLGLGQPENGRLRPNHFRKYRLSIYPFVFGRRLCFYALLRRAQFCLMGRADGLTNIGRPNTQMAAQKAAIFVFGCGSRI